MSMFEVARQRVRHDERRGGEEIHLDFRMHAAFEIPVSGQHRAGDDVARLDRLGDLGLQGAGVADAGRAAVADGVEAERLQIAQAGRPCVR